MLCRHPYIKDRNVTRLATMYDKEARLAATPFPCGQCLHCRINQARVWQHRIILENMSHAESIWVTLTYNDKNFDQKEPFLRKKDVQNYLKRIRRYLPKFRYLCVGEYGMEGKRGINPHYHLCLFGVGKIYANVLFEKWGMSDKEGFIIGEINAHSARYTAGYTTAKLTKRKFFKAFGLPTEFLLSSRKNGGIGYPTIVRIAQKWRKSTNRDERIIRDLQVGRVSYPLGRYLTQKLNELIWVPKEKMDEEYWLHQEEIFTKHMKGDGLDYYESLWSEEKTKAFAKEKRFQIKSKRKRTL